MHENPQVPNYVNRDVKKHDFRLEPGLVLAVEPMLNMGRAETDTLRDHWTVVTRDGLPSVHLEHTLAITPQGVVVVTADEDSPAPNGVPLPDSLNLTPSAASCLAGGVSVPGTVRAS